MTTSLVVPWARSCGASAVSDLPSPDAHGGLGKAKPRGLLGIDRGHVKTLAPQRGVVKPAKRAGADETQRSNPSVPVYCIGELGSDQQPRQARRAIGALLEAQKLRGPQPKQ